MKLSGAEITIKLLEMEGVKTIAGIPGGSILPLYDALYHSDIKHILTRHEQGAGFIAQGIARSTGVPGVCFATSGPGATNLLTAIADAKMDSVPMVAITGQVPLNLIGTDTFQEIDIYGLTIPITKHNFLVRSIEELFTIIPEAFRITKSDRPGPVLIDIPKDIQKQVIEIIDWPMPIYKPNAVLPHVDFSTLDTVADLINTSSKPIIFAGGGVILANAHNELYEFSTKSNIPVTLSLMGLGAFPSDNELSLGMIGMHAAPYTNLLIEEADLILAFGVRFNDRATGNIEKFCPDATIIHVDIDESEINKIKPCHISLQGDVKEILNDLIPIIKEDSRKYWIDQVNNYKKKYPLPLPAEDDVFHPMNIIKHVSKLADENTLIATDVGKHQMWTAQVFPINEPRKLLTSGGLGTMGFGLPAAIGAALVNPDKKIILFSGDGSILMNIQELATVRDHNLNIKILIMNNNQLGLVRQLQQYFCNEHYIATDFISNPNFKLIAEGFGLPSYTLKPSDNPLDRLSEILATPGPALIDIYIKENENVLPIVPPGAGNTEMIGGECNGY